MALYHSPLVVTNGLVLYLDAANSKSYPGTGTTWTDLSRQGNNGTANNGTAFSTLNGGCFVFDGADDYVNIGVNKSCNRFTGDFAVSAWVNRSNTGGTWGNIIGDYYTNSTQTTNEWQIMVSSAGAFNLYVVGPGYVIPPTSNFGVNQWQNIVVTRIATTVTMYLNTTSIATATNASTLGTTTGNLNIGIDGNNSAEPYTGKIAGVMIYKDKGLTAAEVSQNFNALRTRFGI